MPIPRCGEAVGNSFRDSQWRWLLDAIFGHNQIFMSKSYQVKLAFSGPDCSKYTYTVMPFGPVNGPVIFTMFIHDLNSTWQYLAHNCGIIFDAKTGTTIIVDDIFSWVPSFDIAMAYMACQFQVYLSHNLSLSLQKYVFFSRRFEFVCVDCCDNSNCPTMSKRELYYKHWPDCFVARNVASFLGFMNFYSKFIPYFEHRAAPLRALAKLEMTASVKILLTPDHVSSCADLIEGLISDPCIAHHNSKKRTTF